MCVITRSHPPPNTRRVGALARRFQRNTRAVGRLFDERFYFIILYNIESNTLLYTHNMIHAVLLYTFRVE